MAATFCALQTTAGQTVDSGAILPDKSTDFYGRPGILAPVPDNFAKNRTENRLGRSQRRDRTWPAGCEAMSAAAVPARPNADHSARRTRSSLICSGRRKPVKIVGNRSQTSSQSVGDRSRPRSIETEGSSYRAAAAETIQHPHQCIRTRRRRTYRDMAVYTIRC